MAMPPFLLFQLQGAIAFPSIQFRNQIVLVVTLDCLPAICNTTRQSISLFIAIPHSLFVNFWRGFWKQIQFIKKAQDFHINQSVWKVVRNQNQIVYKIWCNKPELHIHWSVFPIAKSWIKMKITSLILLCLNTSLKFRTHWSVLDKKANKKASCLRIILNSSIFK